MSENVEDLYLKGFLAFSEKKYKTAKAYWEKALTIDPKHQKSLKGMADLRALKGAKRSSKEVLQEIKKLYAGQRYGEALKLCELLLKKHPNNQDLKGLRQKISNRHQQMLRQGPSEGKAQPENASSKRFENTAYFQKQAESSVEEDDSAAKGGADQVSKLIQEGVGLYEVQDYERAIVKWNKALELDPDNHLARDYINNVRSFIDEPAETPPPAEAQVEATPPTPEPPPSAAPLGKPNKDALMRLYNEGMALFKSKNYEDAMEKWNQILHHHPTHQETLQCIEKTRALLDKQGKHHEQLELARKELASGNHNAAERILTQLSIEAPDLDGLEQLRTAIEERQRQITEIRSLEIEAEESQIQSDFSPSDDEITRFFTPEAEGKSSEVKQVTEVFHPKPTKQPPSKLVLIGAPILLLALATGGYFGYNYYQQQADLPEDESLLVPLVREVDWNGAEQTAEDFLILGADFADEGDFLLATYAFERVEAIAQPRIEELQNMGAQAIPFEVQEELEDLSAILERAKARHTESKTKIEPQTVDEKDPERAETELSRGLYESGITRMTAILSNDLANERIREKLGEANEKLAFEKLTEGLLEDASKHFRRAAVLKASFDMPRRHTEVIQRYYSGKITDKDKDQWFFFFTD